jgi:hypothetical protein
MSELSYEKGIYALTQVTPDKIRSRIGQSSGKTRANSDDLTVLSTLPKQR